MYLVLGLGNPGGRYRNTRHNAGFMVVDQLARRAGVPCDRKQLGALVDRLRIGDQDVIVAKPQTFMNLSGQAAASLRGFYKVDVSEIIVVHDDVDLPFDDVRVKLGGGHGGHNGLRDIQARLGGNGFIRVRFGVGRPPPGWDTANYVLGSFSDVESARLDDVVASAVDAVDAVVCDGVRAAMNRINARPKAGSPRPDAQAPRDN